MTDTNNAAANTSPETSAPAETTISKIKAAVSKSRPAAAKVKASRDLFVYDNRGRKYYNAAASIKLLAKENPKTGRAAARFALYSKVKTVGEYRREVEKLEPGRTDKADRDLFWDSAAARKYIAVTI